MADRTLASREYYDSMEAAFSARPSATEEERQLRKRRLIRGPKEFRDIRKKSRED